MDWLAGLIVAVASLGGGIGYIVDQSAQNLLRSQLDQAESLEVRIESQPNYRLIDGHIDRILVAGRGLQKQPFPRLAVLEMETDPVSVDMQGLSSGKVTLAKPLQAALRVAITAADLNAALQSPALLGQFQDIKADLPLLGEGNGQPQRFNLQNPRVEFLPDQRIQLSAQLIQQTTSGEAPAVEVTFTSGIEIVTGQRIRLRQAEFTIGSVPVPEEISGAFLGSFNELINLADLEKQGFLVRILKLTVTSESLELVGFIRLSSL